MRKRILATIMSVAMVATMLAGCGGKDNNAKTSTPPSESAKASAPASSNAQKNDLKFEIIVSSFQSSYWQAAVKGVEEQAKKLGVSVNCTGPNAESDIADQVNMLNNAINNAPDGIGLAASDQQACLDALTTAMNKKIPVVCFDTDVPDAPEGSVYATVATDNRSAGATAAENLY